jgi:hypothetical protein
VYLDANRKTRDAIPIRRYDDDVTRLIIVGAYDDIDIIVESLFIVVLPAVGGCGRYATSQNPTTTSSFPFPPFARDEYEDESTITADSMT